MNTPKELFDALDRESEAFNLELALIDETTRTVDALAQFDAALDRVRACMRIVAELRFHSDTPAAERLVHLWDGIGVDVVNLRNRFMEGR